MPPWLLDDGNAGTVGDANLRSAVESLIADAARALAARGLSPSHPDYRREMTILLIAGMHRDRNSGGLGLQYRFNADGSHRRLTAVEAFAAGHGDCNSFSFLFYAMTKRAGLDPTFIRITGERDRVSGRMEELLHVGVAVRLNPSRPDDLTAVDPSRSLALTGNDHQWYPVSGNEMMAFHLRNVAFYNVDRAFPEGERLDWQEERLRRAAELAPHNFEIANDLNVFYRSYRTDEAAARPYGRTALSVNPSLRRIWNAAVSHP
jgi:hypothetical protein